MKQIAVFGVGAMGTALISAIKRTQPDLLVAVFDKDEAKLNLAVTDYGLQAGNDELLADAELIVLAVKPQDMTNLLDSISAKLNPNQTVLSIAAGITLAKLTQHITQAGVIRCMPNTPALVGAGFSTISTSNDTAALHLDRAVEFLAASGKTLVIPEELQDSFTAIHGSGPAYVFLLIEALISAAEQAGISQADATAAVIETVLGAALLIQQTGESATTLRERVTSPGGTTAAALNVFAEGGFTELVHQAVQAAKARAAQLG